MDKYMGFKLIEAEPAIRMANGDVYSDESYIPKNQRGVSFQEGYRVVYADGYESWSPKVIFDSAYMKVGSNNTITKELVEDFIVDYEVFTKKDKITIVIATLRNGFTIVESSACVDPANYNQEIGAEICKERIENQVWNQLGFLLQTALKGVK